MGPPQTVSSPVGALTEVQLRQLLRASQAFNSTIELETLIPRILELTVDTCEAEAGSLWVLEGEVLQCRYALGPAAERMMWLELPLGAGIEGDVALRRRSVLLQDARNDPRYLPQIEEITGFSTHAVVAAPLIAHGEVLGVLELVNPRAGATNLDEEDLHFLEAIADDAAAALRNAKLFDSEKRARDLRALLEVSHEITSTFDLDRVLVSIVNLAGQAVRFDRCVLAVWDDEKLRVRGISGETTVDRRAAAVRELEHFLSWIAQRREQLLIPDIDEPTDAVAADVRAGFRSYLDGASVRALFSLPIRDSEGDLGVLHFEFTEPTQLEEWEREAAELLVNQCALAIRNAQLYTAVPFISWLEPLRAKKQRLAALPGPLWLAYAGVGTLVALALLLVPVPMRVGASDAQVRALVQRPVRAEVAGVIDAVLVREGQQVSQGTPVAALRNEELLRRQREAAAEAELAERAALAADARGDRTAAALARVRLAEATQAAALLQREVQRFRIMAPTTGTVLSPRVHERAGGYVSAGDTIAWIGDARWVELEIPVKQEDLALIRINTRVRAKSSSHPGVVLRGTVVAIAPRASSVPTASAPRYIVRANIDNASQLLRPGMSVHSKIAVGWRPLAQVVFRRPWRWLRMHLWW